MKIAPTTQWPVVGYLRPADAGEHAKALMKDFDIVKTWLEDNCEDFSNFSMQRFKKTPGLGVKQGANLGLQDASQGIYPKVEKKSDKVVERGIEKEVSKGLALGVLKVMFDQLYKSYTELATKLEAKDRSAQGYSSRSHQRLPKRLPRASITPRSSRDVSEKSARQHGEQSLCPDGGATRRWSEDSETFPELPEDHTEESFDMCCICGTPSEQEEHIVTTCCHKSIGSICFEEAMQETGQCCLCQVAQSHFESGTSIGQSEQELKYKFRFIDNQNQAEDSGKDNSVSGVASQPDTGVAYASWDQSSPPLVASWEESWPPLVASWEASSPSWVRENSAEPLKRPRETNEWTTRTSETSKLEGKLPQGTGSFSNLWPEPSKESHEDSSTHRRSHRVAVSDNDLESSPNTIEYEFVLRLSDQAVISYLKGLSEEDVLATVHGALEDILHLAFEVACEATATFEALLLESGDIELKFEMIQGQTADLKDDAATLADILEGFVNDRLGTYTVMMHSMEVEAMKLSDEVQKLRAIEELVGYNASSMQYLSRPDDVRNIRWTANEKKVHTLKVDSVILGLATAAQANEFIARGLLWKGKRRYCVRHGPKRKLIQCDDCQNFGHIADNCTSSPRCQACAEGHESKDCPHGPNPSLKNMKCALCGGRHKASDYFCTVKRGEELRLQLENRFYPTEADNVTASSAKKETSTSPLEQSYNNPLPVIPPSQVSNSELYSDVGNATPVVEQGAPLAIFDKEIVVQHTDGLNYAVPARLVDSSISASSDYTYVW